MKKQIYLNAAFAILFGITMQAQEKDKNMGTEVVKVVKSYEATVADAFKIKDNPQIDDKDNEKREIKYSIYSFPVASTFAPEKGIAAEVEKDTVNTFSNNYALLGYGNFNTIRGELGIAEKINEDIYVAGMLNHISSQGGILGVLVDDNYSKSNLDFNIGSKKVDTNWNANFGVSQNNFNWYGLPSDNLIFAPAQYINRDFGQKYNDIYLGGNYQTNKDFFKGGNLTYKYFWDDFDSKENHFKFNPNFNLDINETNIDLSIKADYLNTSYASSSDLNSRNKYNYLILGIEPSVRFFEEDYSVELGFGISNISGKSNGVKDNSIAVYPKVKANYDLVKNIVIAYAGAEGGVTNNTYSNYVTENPFVSPNLDIKPTQQQFNFYLGMKGKLYHNVSYNIRASYLSEDNKPMFVNNPKALTFDLLNSQVYQYGNSFGVIYNLVKTFNVYGELNLNFTDDVSIDLSGEINSYSVENGNAYNLPESKVSAKVRIDFTDQWFGGLNLNYVGQRSDLGYVINSSGMEQRTAVKVDSFVDLNLNIGYKADNNWTIFAKGNNLFNKSYQIWNNYKVQSAQVLVGAMYKFNFKN